jgi:hypothetical protein
MIGKLDVPDPPDGWVYLDAVVLIKCVDDSGAVRYKEMRSNDLPLVEALGMVTTYTDTIKAQIMRLATEN